jgi:hypothetical protein
VLPPRRQPSIQILRGAVISTRNRSEPQTPLRASAPIPGRAIFHFADVLLPVGLGLWALGISRTDVAVIGPYGLVTALPVVFYAGVALLIVSAAIELARDRPSSWRMSMHAVALVVMLYGTAPLLYSQGRYSWLYKTIGVVQYVNAHGHLNSHIDIYQNWPGFFALAAWFGKVAGVASPLAYAKWAQLVFELAALGLIYLSYEALSVPVRQRWVALLLYSASNWIGQDYFSPQALGTLLSLGIIAIALRWLKLGNSSWSCRLGHEPRIAGVDQSDSRQSLLPAGRLALFCSTIVLIYFVLTFTHELSPYILVVQLGVLVGARLLRPWWLPLVLVAIAIGYLLPRYTYVNTHYGLLNSIGDFFRNFAPPASKVGAVARSELLIERCAEALSLIMLCLAVAGAWLRRRSGRSVRALGLLAFSPFILLVAQHYGNEGILRAYLFSLPWTAALAALALASKSGGHRASPKGGAAILNSPLARSTLRSVVALGLVVALFFPAFFGDDSFNRMPQSEVAAITFFLERAPAGPVYCAINNAPMADTARYNLYPLKAIFGSHSLMGTAPVRPDIANVIANNSLIYTHGRRPAYLLIAPSMIAYNQAYGVTPSKSFTILLDALAHSPAWRLVVYQAGTAIYELPPTAVHP